MENVKNRLDLAVDWLLHSGIINPDGGVYCWYDIKKDEYPFIYPEITAYAVSTLLNLGRIEQAVKVGKWLIHHSQYIGSDYQGRGGFFWKIRSHVHFKSDYLYSFDTGMCIDALTRVFLETGEEKFLNSAMDGASWLKNVMQNKDGSFKPRYNLNDESFEYEDRWSRKPGLFHAKIAIPLLKLSDIASNDLRYSFLASSEYLCNWVSKTGIFVDDTVYLHDLCYAAEGLLYTSQELSNKEYELTAVWYASKIADAQGPNGGVGRWFKREGYAIGENTEATAQAVRLWIILSQMYSKDEFFHKNIEKGIDYLLSKQYLGRIDTSGVSEKGYGGFYYAVVNGELLPHINTCATLFAIQALQMYLDWKNEVLVRPLEKLV